MASQPPSTPVKVSASAANYTPATLDPTLRSDINSTLIHRGQVTEIQESLLHSLHANQADWPTAIQTHALNLLRSGEATTFPALLRKVMEDIRQDTALHASTVAAAAAAAANNNNNGDDSTITKKSSEPPRDPDRPSLVVPQELIDEALRVTREKIEPIIMVHYDSQNQAGGGGDNNNNASDDDNDSNRGGGSATPSAGGGKK